MDKKSKTKNYSGGIKLSIGIRGERNPKSKNLIWIVDVLLVVLGTFGALYSFASSYELTNYTVVILFASLICGAAAGFLYTVRKIAVWILPCCLAVLIAAGFAIKDDLYKFGIYLWNNAAGVLAAQDFELPFFSGGSSQNFNSIYVWFFAAFFFAVIIGFFAVYKIHFLPVLIITFIPLELGLYFGLVPGLASVICFFACNSAVTAKWAVQTKRKNIINLKNKSRSYSGSYGTAIVSLMMCLFFASSLLVSYWGISISGYERPERFNELRENFRNFDISKLFEKQENAVDLSLQGNREYDYQTDLIVEMPADSGTLYLKSVTGSEYSENKWLDLEASAYEKSPVGTMLQQNISVSELFASSAISNTRLGVMKFRLMSDAAGKTFLPYGFYNNGSLSLDYDKGALNTSDSSEYTVSFDRKANNIWGELCSDSYYKSDSAYWELENEYTDFVNEYYTQLPQGLERLKQEAEAMPQSSLSYREKVIDSVKKVQAYLKENAQYSLEPGYTPSDKDFAEYFLYENKKGYCVHFATAGVLLLRAMGIPARYAEGYVITSKDYENAVNLREETVTADCLAEGSREKVNIHQKTASIELKDSNAHAWAEVYIEGLGWFPCEMTPGVSQTETAMGEDYNGSTLPVQEDTRSENNYVTDITEPEATEAVSESSTYASIQDSTASYNYKADTKGNNSFMILLFIIGIMLVIFVSDILIRRAVILRRKRSFHSKKSKESVKAMYKYLEKLVALTGCKYPKSQTLTDFFEQIFKTFDFLKEEECVEEVLIFQKAFYSEENVTCYEQKKVEMFVTAFASQWLEEQNTFKQFIYKYLMFVV